MATKGKFIVFEGTDGSGKSTQMKMLGKYLKTKGIPVYGTHEPTESPFGALLRSCLTGAPLRRCSPPTASTISRTPSTDF